MTAERNMIKVDVAPEGQMIYVKDKLKDREHYKGPDEFEAVVFFDDGIKEMRGKMPDEEQWTSENLPPERVSILEFIDPKVESAIDEISELATNGDVNDPDDRDRYYELNKQIYETIVDYSNLDGDEVVFMGLIRAGLVAGEMAGFGVESQVLVQTKRLYLKDERIGIGITYEDESQIQNINGKTLIIGDPAGATMASMIANVAYLLEQGVKPEKVVIWNVVSSHAGILFAKSTLEEMGVEVEFIAGGYSPELNDKYYLVTKDGDSSVADAGDWLNEFLPEKYRL